VDRVVCIRLETARCDELVAVLRASGARVLPRARETAGSRGCTCTPGLLAGRLPESRVECSGWRVHSYCRVSCLPPSPLPPAPAAGPQVLRVGGHSAEEELARREVPHPAPNPPRGGGAPQGRTACVSDRERRHHRAKHARLRTVHSCRHNPTGLASACPCVCFGAHIRQPCVARMRATTSGQS
jgi:hypothetical protein